MLIVVVFALGLLVIRLRGGVFSRLNHLRLRRSSIAAGAVITQVAITSVWPTGWKTGHLLINLATYAALGVFLWLNRRIPWLWVVALGTACNTLAIAANGGIMPASAWAMAVAHPTRGHGFVNSAPVAHPRLLFLGDIAPTPGWLPFHNVASIGDILIVAGALCIVAHQTGREPSRAMAGARPIPLPNVPT